VQGVTCFLLVITSFLFGLEKLIISKFIQKFILTATSYITEVLHRLSSSILDWGVLGFTPPYLGLPSICMRFFWLRLITAILVIIPFVAPGFHF
jgi:hypothetical protein